MRVSKTWALSFLMETNPENASDPISQRDADTKQQREIGPRALDSKSLYVVALLCGLSTFLYCLRFSLEDAVLGGSLNALVVFALVSSFINHRNPNASSSDPLSLYTEVSLSRVSLRTLYAVSAAALTLTAIVFLPVFQILSNTTPTGGDVAAHVWFPDALARQLLPHLSGWSDDWYAGFPAGALYFPLPALITLILNIVLPYGIAFKLTILTAAVLPPFATWRLSRRISLSPLYPVAFTAATVCFQLERFHTIYGANLASVYAGMFSLALGFGFGILALSALIPFLKKERDTVPVTFPILLVCAALSHLLSGVFVALLSLCFVLVFQNRLRSLRKLALPSLSAVLMAGLWWMPFLRSTSYATDMGYAPTRSISWVLPFLQSCVGRGISPGQGVSGVCASNSLYSRMLNGETGPVGQYWIIIPLALAATVWAFLTKRRAIMGFSLTALVFIGMYALWPTTYVWDARWLPFYWWSLWMLAAAALVHFSQILVRSQRAVVALVLIPSIALMSLTNFHRVSQTPTGWDIPKPLVASWGRWDFSGYESKTDWPEYRGVMDLLSSEGKKTGCGRAHWEYDKAQGSYGSPMAMMLIPYWTDGCVDSVEGLFMEGSQTTPFHFMMQYATSQAGSGPVRDMPYPGYDLKWGVDSMRAMGVKWFLAYNEATIKDARAATEDLVELGSVPMVSDPNKERWVVFRVKDSSPVEVLPSWPVSLPEGSWPIDYARAFKADPTGMFSNAPGLKSGAAPKASLSDVSVSDSGVSFRVSQTGVPVAVRFSWYPSWRVSGADGVYRLGPNMILVVPTSNTVTLSPPVPVGRQSGEILSLVGVALFGAFVFLNKRSKRRSLTLDKSTNIKDTLPLAES